VPKKTSRASKRPASLSWEFDPDIPTHDFFEGGSLDDLGNLEEAVDSFVWWLEEGCFLTWEAVICEEQDIPLTPRQKKRLGGLLNFNDVGDGAILYIDEIPRPSEPWYVIFKKIVPHLLIEPYRTFDCHEQVNCEGWNRIATGLLEHGQGLSLPPSVESWEALVPVELRHKLWLQRCFNSLDGLGQDASLTLKDPEEHYRMNWFFQSLRECKATVAYFHLTLESLLNRLVLPPEEQAVFVKMMQDKLGLGSPQEQIASHL